MGSRLTPRCDLSYAPETRFRLAPVLSPHQVSAQQPNHTLGPRDLQPLGVHEKTVSATAARPSSPGGTRGVSQSECPSGGRTPGAGGLVRRPGVRPPATSSGCEGAFSVHLESLTLSSRPRCPALVEMKSVSEEPLRRAPSLQTPVNTLSRQRFPQISRPLKWFFSY